MIILKYHTCFIFSLVAIFVLIASILFFEIEKTRNLKIEFNELKIEFLHHQSEAKQEYIRALRESLFGIKKKLLNLNGNDYKNASLNGNGNEGIKSLNRNMTLNDLINNSDNSDNFLIPQSSDVTCLGEEKGGLTCKFHNLCINVKSEKFYILKSPSSLIGGSKEEGELMIPELLDLTSIIGHNLFYWSLDGISHSNFLLDSIKRGEMEVRIANWNMRSDMETSFLPLGKSRLTIVREPLILTKRFYPLNVMHCIHDDLLGLYTLRDYWSFLRFPEYFDQEEMRMGRIEGMENEQEIKDREMRKDNQNSQIKREMRIDNQNRHDSTGIVFWDDYSKNPNHDPIYEWLGVPIRKMENLLGWPGWPPKDQRREEHICFRDVVVGNSHQMFLYQYGYDRMQGPVENTKATGWKLREIAMTIMKELGLPRWNVTLQREILESINLIQRGESDNQQNESGKNEKNGNEIKNGQISIISRKSDRLILNEEELKLRLEGEFGILVKFIRMEEMSLNQIVGEMSKSIMAIGMHGALLAMSMFLPPGGVLIEGYPWGVPAKNYTPYRSMTTLNGTFLIYQSWENHNKTASVSHPFRPSRRGGISHLDSNQQEKIKNERWVGHHLCCEDPSWLYHIFQDTIVDIDAIINISKNALEEAKRLLGDLKNLK